MRTAIEEDPAAVRVARLLHLQKAAVAERRRRHVAGHVVGVVRHADLADDPRRRLDLRRQHDRLRIVVLAGGRSLRGRVRVVHVRRPHAARRIRIEPLQSVRVEEHRSAHAVRLREPREDLVDARDAGGAQKLRRPCAPLRRRRARIRRHRQRLEATDLAHRLDLDVDEVRPALGMGQGALDERGHRPRHGCARHDLLRPGDVHSRRRSPHLDREPARVTHGSPPSAPARPARTPARPAPRRCARP